MVRAVVIASLMASLFGGCEEPAPPRSPATPKVKLSISATDAGGKVHKGTLVCPARTDEDDAPCRAVTADPGMFAPPEAQMCTQIYGGPETAHVTGVIDGNEVLADFRRNNGCEISRWDRLRPLWEWVMPGYARPSAIER